MAQRVQVLVVCDMHGDETPADETASFALDGTGYEIDVCGAHAVELRDALAPYVGAARKGRGASRGGGRGGRGRRREGGRAHEIREWARAQGIEVSERGRISAELAAQYDAARR